MKNNIEKDTLYTIDWVEKSGTVLRKDKLQFLFGYHDKSHSSVYFKYFENSPFYENKIKELDVTKGRNLLAKRATERFNYNGDLLSTTSDFFYVKRCDVDSLFNGNGYYKRTKLVETKN